MESFSDLGAILLMQGFNGLSVFSVLLLMALGLALIFGQMGVINMAHGEFLAIGAYTTYLVSTLARDFAPGCPITSCSRSRQPSWWPSCWAG
jgi:urea transport system permease protein